MSWGYPGIRYEVRVASLRACIRGGFAARRGWRRLWMPVRLYRSHRSDLRRGKAHLARYGWPMDHSRPFSPEFLRLPNGVTVQPWHGCSNHEWERLWWQRDHTPHGEHVTRCVKCGAPRCIGFDSAEGLLDGEDARCQLERHHASPHKYASGRRIGLGALPS